MWLRCMQTSNFSCTCISQSMIYMLFLLSDYSNLLVPKVVQKGLVHLLGNPKSRLASFCFIQIDWLSLGSVACDLGQQVAEF